MNSGTMSPWASKNAGLASTYTMRPPDAAASAASSWFTASIAAVCCPGCAYFPARRRLPCPTARPAPWPGFASACWRMPEPLGAYVTVSPGAGGTCSFWPSGGPRGRIPGSTIFEPGSMAVTVAAQALIPRKVSWASSPSRPRLLVPIIRTTALGACRKFSSPPLSRNSRC